MVVRIGFSVFFGHIFGMRCWNVASLGEGLGILRGILLLFHNVSMQLKEKRIRLIMILIIIYFCTLNRSNLNRMTTIGFGDLVPRK